MADDRKCPECGRPKDPDRRLCRECYNKSKSGSTARPGGGAPRGGGTPAPAALPSDLVFESFYDENGTLKLAIFYEAAEKAAKAFRKADLKSSSFRRLYQSFLGFAGPLRDRRMDFPSALERFATFWVEGVVRQEQRGFLPSIVKDFVDKHRAAIERDQREMLAFFRYLTNVYCYFGDKG